MSLEGLKEKPHEINPCIQLFIDLKDKVALYSGLAQMAGDMCVYPLDTMCTRIKANTNGFISLRQQYNSIVKKEGFMMLYRGFSTTYVGGFVPSVTYFFVYEYLNGIAVKLTSKVDKQRYKYINLMIPLVTAPIAELACVLTWIPFETIKTRMQMNCPEFHYKGILDGLQQISQKEGLLRLFKASHLFMGQMMVYTSMQFWMYEMFRYACLKQRNQKRDLKKLTIFESIVGTLISTSLAVVIVNPIDVLITRFQLVDSGRHQLSSYNLVKDLIVNEGRTAIFKGLGVRMISCNLYSLFYLPVYEHFKSKYGVILKS